MISKQRPPMSPARGARDAILAAAILAAATLPAEGAVYRCIDANGRVEFSDNVCPSGTIDRARQAIGPTNGMSAPRGYVTYRDTAPKSQVGSTGEPSYADRNAIRELEMKDRELAEEQRRIGSHGLGNLGKALAVGAERTRVQQHIQDLRTGGRDR